MTARTTKTRTLGLLGCGLAIVSSTAALTLSTGTRSIDRSVASAIPSVASAWRVASPDRVVSDLKRLSPVVLRKTDTAVGAPVSGDEGFWLNAKALAGGDEANLAVGEQVTIGGRTYAIVELQPLASKALGGEPSPSRQVTLVVAREANPEGTPARTVRFVIEGEQTAPPAAPASTVAAPTHRTL